MSCKLKSELYVPLNYAGEWSFTLKSASESFRFWENDEVRSKSLQSFQEDLLIHGDSVYDIIDKQDHQAIQCELGRPVNSGGNNGTNDEMRLFLCRMNVSRNARRQMRFGDQKVLRFHLEIMAG